MCVLSYYLKVGELNLLLNPLGVLFVAMEMDINDLFVMILVQIKYMCHKMLSL